MSRKLRHRSHHGVHPEDENIGGEEESLNEVELLAYEYWQERGCPVGSPEVDWSRAEEELQRREEAAARL